MTTTAPTVIPIAEYLARSYRPDREYIDGIVEERNLGDYDHARLQTALMLWFGNRHQEWNIRVLVEQRVQVSPTRFRVPDVTVLDRAQPVEQVLTRTPLVAIEVLSSEDTWSRFEYRIADYLKFGIPNVWILDPATRRGWIVFPDGRRSLTTTLAAAGSPITVSLDELFTEAE
jgi:Uma2 family endonuclease